MYGLIVEHARNGIWLPNHEDKWAVLSVTGLQPVPSQLVLQNVAGMDGQRYAGQKMNTRNIVITLRLTGNVEENRNELYYYFPQNRPLKIYYTNDTHDVYIEGYVETIECDLFSSDEIFQVSILCPDPLFKDLESKRFRLGHYDRYLEFPIYINAGEPIPIDDHLDTMSKLVENRTQLDLPMEIEAVCTVAGFNPTIYCAPNDFDDEWIGFNLSGNGMAVGDSIKINTDPAGLKCTYKTAGGVESNLFPKLKNGASFPVIRPGYNTISYTSTNGDGIISFTYRNRYRGV